MTACFIGDHNSTSLPFSLLPPLTNPISLTGRREGTSNQHPSMESYRSLFFSILILTLAASSTSQSVIQLYGDRKFLRDDSLYCESWRFSVETNDAGPWRTIPSKCQKLVQDYMTGERYLSDSLVVAEFSSELAKSIKINGDGKDAWVFDIDETLLSNVPYYEAHGFGSEQFDEVTFDAWVDLAAAPALPASLSLYKELQQLGFKIFLLTGRSEHQRNVTEKNLLQQGYTNWEHLILRTKSDQGKSAVTYKSERRSKLEDEGYRIHGSSGDQWSDLVGFALARRSFKLPNPMYYIA